MANIAIAAAVVLNIWNPLLVLILIGVTLSDSRSILIQISCFLCRDIFASAAAIDSFSRVSRSECIRRIDLLGMRTQDVAQFF